jgi:hypothetical protein
MRQFRDRTQELEGETADAVAVWLEDVDHEPMAKYWENGKRKWFSWS